MNKNEPTKECGPYGRKITLNIGKAEPRVACGGKRGNLKGESS